MSWFTITKPSGSKPATVKIPAKPCNASIRGTPNPGKGSQSPPHYHINLPKPK